MKPSIKIISIIALVTLIFVIIDTAYNIIAIKLFPDSIAVSGLGILLVAVPLLLAYPLYSYLRRHNISSRSEVQTALILMAGMALSTLISLYLTQPLLGEDTSGYGVMALAISNGVVAFILGVVGAAIARKVYDRHNSIITE